MTFWPRLLYDPRYRLMWRYKRAGGDALRYRYPLSSASIVVDAGAYVGEFAGEIVRRFACTVHAFEAVPDFADRIPALPGLTVHRFALGAADGTARFSLDGVASTVFARDGAIEVPVRDVVGVFDRLGLDRIDLLKLNIEGGEFDVLDRLLDAGRLPVIDHLLVQFHRFVPDADRRRDAIRARLAATHAEQWCFPWIWESWSRSG